MEGKVTVKINLCQYFGVFFLFMEMDRGKRNVFIAGKPI